MPDKGDIHKETTMDGSNISNLTEGIVKDSVIKSLRSQNCLNIFYVPFSDSYIGTKLKSYHKRSKQLHGDRFKIDTMQSFLINIILSITKYVFLTL